MADSAVWDSSVLTHFAPPCPRVGFLFNHDHLHQIAHSAPIAFELARSAPQVEVTLLASSLEQLSYLKRLAAAAPWARCEIRMLALPNWLRALRRPLDSVMPFTRLATLRANLAEFRSLDVLVVPEKTSLMLRTYFGLKLLKFVHTRHGAGDREVGFDRSSAGFDLVLMSGEKIRDRLRCAGLLRDDAFAIVGYPKFDLHASAGPRPRLFDNDLPTVLYNPHFSPRLSSWYRNGQDILESFYRSGKYNLIFAPHVMLFRKRLQVSLDRFRFDAPGAIPQRYRDCPHMLIDTGSERSVDMTYTRAADLYLGDASSQVYEFLVEPRPCLFINAQRTAWHNDPNFAHWNAGPVLTDAGLLEAALAEAFATHDHYRARQQEMFAYSFDLTDQPSSQRGAAAILQFVAGL